jgi:uncharacterized membrane protein YraQ (UPF0718 family)
MFEWTQIFSDWLTYDLLGLIKGNHLADALNFFVYDTIKIFILLFFISILMGIINSYFPIEKVRFALQKRKWYGLDYFFASFFGTVTPFCSCSSVPLFIGFVQGGIPLGITLAFLISSPLVDAVTVAMFMGMFGLKATLIYVVSGIIISMIAGFILGKLHLERFLTPWVKQIIANKQKSTFEFQEEKSSLIDRLPLIFSEAMGIVKGVAVYILIGVAVGGLMHGFIPTNFFEQYIGKDNLLAVPIAVLLGIPMYTNTAGILPVMEVLVQKGIPLGTVVAFSMAVVGLSFPEAMLLKKVMNGKMLAIFFGVVTICIILSGYIFNLIL